ncbi:DNA-processing protein DprA [Patescibacteria group bacterium]|nr:DNA-processing protein DprA [Patescibacteria group bacterium]MBU1931761.1 DNA-processing protein DprA [Patescibacteria group bacterium]
MAKIKNPPEILYYHGQWEASIFQHCLAVVGTRKMTDYGEEMVERLVGPVARAGVTIISGFMYGVDAATHQAALNVGGRTIAVLGCGIDLIRPAIHRELHMKIIESNGLIVSELPGKHPPARWTFVKRNRIVAGLSQASLIIEAGEQSGALITAQLTQDQGKPVLALPGPVTSGVSYGTSRLIKNGAQLVTTAKDILAVFKLSCPPGVLPTGGSKHSGNIDLPQEEKEIYQLLQDWRLSVDQLARQFQRPAAQMGTTLSLMVLKGLIKEDKQSRYYI